MEFWRLCIVSSHRQIRFEYNAKVCVQRNRISLKPVGKSSQADSNFIFVNIPKTRGKPAGWRNNYSRWEHFDFSILLFNFCSSWGWWSVVWSRSKVGWKVRAVLFNLFFLLFPHFQPFFEMNSNLKKELHQFATFQLLQGIRLCQVSLQSNLSPRVFTLEIWLGGYLTMSWTSDGWVDCHVCALGPECCE